LKNSECSFRGYLEFNELVKISSVTLSNNESIELTDMKSDPEVMESYLTGEVLLPKRDKLKLGKVVCCLTDKHNHSIEKANNNPILGTREYVVEFDDGEQLEYATNIITKNIYAQVDAEGRSYMLMESIIDYRKDEIAVPKDDEYVVVNGRSSHQKTTDGWRFNIQWKDGSTGWEPLRTLKEANPVERVEYDAANKIASKPAFVWWVTFTIQKRLRYPRLSLKH
jgi:hypothetical protein